MTTLGSNATLIKRFNYDRTSLTDNEILDALVELETWKDQMDGQILDEVIKRIVDLEEKVNDLKFDIEKLEMELGDVRSDLYHVNEELEEMKGV